MDRIDQAIDAIRHKPDDQEAWAEFYTYFYRQIAGMFFMLGICKKVEVEDLCQEVFYRFLKYNPWRDDWKSLPLAGKLLAYLRVVARRVLYDSYRKSSKDLLRLDDTKETANLVNESSSGQQLIMVEINEDWNRLLKGLSDNERQLIEALVDGLTLPEIAKRLGISYGSAAVRLHRLRGRLQQSDDFF